MKTHLQNTKDKKDDEFYTRFEDIEKELDKVVATNGRLVYLYERNKENKIIEPYSVKNYFTKVLLNYDPSKIKFL